MSGRAELWRALGAFCEAPGPAHDRIAGALGLPRGCRPDEHATVFELETHPYASVHLGPEGMLGGEAADRVAGFWRALGLVPPAEPDHLAALLGLVGALADDEDRQVEPARAAIRRRARRALLWEHVAPWIDPYLAAVRSLGVAPASGWAAIVRDAVVAELRELGPLDVPPAHLATAQVAAEAADLRTFAAQALAPARTGIVLTRADLRRGAAETGAGARIGERAFALRSMLEQAPAGTLCWLAGEADRWAAHHRAARRDLGAIAEAWEERAAAAAARFRQHSTAAEEVDARAGAGER